jgi:succinoglycan biosynthesis transport protein ExoP
MSSEATLQQVVRPLRRQSGLILAVACTGAGLAGLAGFAMPLRYSAKAEIVIQPQLSNSAAGQEILPPPEQDEAIVQTHLAALASRDHLQRVLDSLPSDPQSQSTLKAKIDRTGGLARVRQTAVAWLDKTWSSLVVWTEGLLWGPNNAGTIANQTESKARQSRLEAFERHLVVNQERGSHVISITFTSTDPNRAANAANLVAEGYVDRLYEQKRENINRTLSWISRRIAELHTEAEAAETKIQKYRLEHGLAEGNQTNVADQRLVDLNHQLTAAESDLAVRQARLASIGELRRRGTSVDTLVQTLDSAPLRELRDREIALLQSRAELSAMLGETHPRTQTLLAQLGALRGKIAREVDRAAADQEAEVRVAEAQVRSLQNRVASAQEVSSQAQTADVQLRDLERAAASIRQVYESLLQRREQLTEHQEMMAPDVRILSLAAPPDRPSSPNPLLFIPPALIVFLIGGGLFAVVRERFDEGLRSAQDLSKTLAIPCVGLVPRIPRTERMRPHQLLLAKPLSAYAEAVRSVLAAMSLVARADDKPRVILVTSSVPREGKSTLAVSLGVHAALLGRRTVVVNVDWRRPGIARELGTEVASGVSDQRSRNDLSLTTIQSVPGLTLDFLPLGSSPSNPLLPFARGDLPRLLNRLRLNYDCIVIDSPPLLAVTEARLFAAMADKILFVVKWASTRSDVAQNALRLLHDVCLLGGKDYHDIVSGVVAQVDLNKHSKYRYGDIGESFARYPEYYAEPADVADATLSGNRSKRAKPMAWHVGDQ